MLSYFDRIPARLDYCIFSKMNGSFMKIYNFGLPLWVHLFFLEVEKNQ